MAPGDSVDLDSRRAWECRDLDCRPGTVRSAEMLAVDPVVAESFSVILLDLDEARLYSPPLPKTLRRANFKRLARSARKLDPVGRYLDSASSKRLGISSP